MDKKIVVVERTYDAPLEKVWAAITDKDQLKQWYFDLSDFKPEIGFRFTFPGQGHKGEQYIHLCTITEVIPKKKLQYSWEYEGTEGYSLVTFELFEIEENKTKLVLTHQGLETFPDENADFAPGSFNEGWNAILGESLRNFVEMDSFSKSIRISANLKDIWDIVLHPDNQWGFAFGDGAIADTDWKEGSSIIWRDTENNIGANGMVEVHQPEEYLQLHYYDDVKPKPEAKLGDYYEKFRLVSDEEENILSIEIGKMAKSDIPFHQEMWDKAINIIKELGEKK